MTAATAGAAVRVRNSLSAGALTTAGAILVALVIGGLLILWSGGNPIEVYRLTITESLFARTGWRDTLTQATPLILIGLGLAIGFRAGVWNIGAEGQMVLGALASIAVLGGTSMPTIVAVPLGLVLGAMGGMAWAAIAGILHTRFGVNTVIATLLLVFVATSLLVWATRTVLKDPESRLPQSRVIGSGAIPDLPWLDTGSGVLLALAAVPLLHWILNSTRFGYIVRAHGDNATAVYANEERRTLVPLVLLMLGGAFAGIAGYVVLASDQIRVASGTAAGFGFTAIIVAILGRNKPYGVLAAAIGLAALLVGAEAAQRRTGVPVTLMQTVQGLIVVCVITARALVERGDRLSRHAREVDDG